MKWSIVGLLFLGTLAAASAVLFVVAFNNKARAQQPEAQVTEVAMATVLVAKGELDSRTVVRSEQLVAKEVEDGLQPEGSYADPVQVVGKLLVKPLAEGQAFTEGCFAEPGSGVNLAAALTPGMRAVSVAVVESMAMGTLIYPGSMVDVITAFKGRGEEPISVTLLSGVMVLAIGERTITDSDKPMSSSAAQNRRLTVTLLVNPDQAEQLKLASEEGTVSLALRNPMDQDETRTRGARLSEISPALAHSTTPAADVDFTAKFAAAEQKLREAIAKSLGDAQAKTASQSLEDADWEVSILRGGVHETKSFASSAALRGDQ